MRRWFSANVHIFVGIGVFLIICIAVVLRWQTARKVSEGWLDTDIYRFVRQAQMIHETGGLPDRDDMRWLPFGRDLTRQLSLSSYVLAGIYRGLLWLRPDSTLFDAVLIYPVICISLAFLVFYALIARLFDRLTGLIALLFFATIPTAVIRSSGGYADRDSLCLLLGLCVLWGFAHALEAESARDRLLWGLAAGFAQGLMYAVWEGSVLFASIISAFFVWKVLTAEIQTRHIILCLAWSIPSALFLLFWTKTHHNFAPYTVLAWGAPLFAIVCLTGSLVNRRLVRRFQARMAFLAGIPVGLTTVVLSIGLLVACAGILTVFRVVNTADLLFALWDNIRTPLGKSRLMASLAELQQPYATDWARWYGPSDVIFMAGSLIVVRRLALGHRFDPWLAMTVWLVLVGGAVHTRFSPFDPNVNAGLMGTIWAILAIASVATLGFLAIRRRSEPASSSRIELDKLALALGWFCVMFVVARGATRYQFFFAPTVATFLAVALIAPVRYVWNRPSARLIRIPSAVALAIVVALMSAAFARRSLAGLQRAPVTPAFSLRTAMGRMKSSLPSGSVVAAWWDHGSQLNWLANVSTLIDEDHFIPYQIYLMARHVFCPSNAREALSFLKAHGATHLMLSESDMTVLGIISKVGSDERLDRETMEPIPLISDDKPTPTEKGGLVVRFATEATTNFPLGIPGQKPYPAGKWTLQGATVEFERTATSYRLVTAHMNVRTSDGKSFSVVPQQVRLNGKEKTQVGGNLPGVVVLASPEKKASSWSGYYVSEPASKMLAVRLFLFGENVAGFRQVYPEPTKGAFAPVRVWELDYPAGTPASQEYLLTDFPSETLRTAWMRGGDVLRVR